MAWEFLLSLLPLHLLQHQFSKKNKIQRHHNFFLDTVKQVDKEQRILSFGKISLIQHKVLQRNLTETKQSERRVDIFDLWGK